MSRTPKGETKTSDARDTVLGGIKEGSAGEVRENGIRVSENKGSFWVGLSHSQVMGWSPSIPLNMHKDVKKVEAEQERMLGSVFVNNDKKKGFAEKLDFSSPKGEAEGRMDLNKKTDLEEREYGDKPEAVVIENEDSGKHKFSVGDFVWGKAKSHLWWPGQIFDSCGALDYAVKYKQRGRFLVAYFGDGTFAWCNSSQLKPFDEEFEQMVSQSTLHKFTNAVGAALVEIDRHVELQITCSCVSKENIATLVGPAVANPGIHKVKVHKGDIGIGHISQFEPTEVLRKVRDIARTASVTNMLEFTVLVRQLMAFFHFKGCREMQMFHEPKHIAGLGDNAEAGDVGNGGLDTQVEIPIQGPVEYDWVSLPVEKTSHSESYALSSKDKLHQRRKQKSIAEILENDEDVEPKNKTNKRGTSSSKMGSISSKNKREGIDDSDSTPSSGRKKMKLFGASLSVNDDDDSSVETSYEKDDSRRGIVNGRTLHSELRERKRSKYLSPPYTNPTYSQRNTSSKKDANPEFLKVDEKLKMGERMMKVAGQIMESPRITKKVSREPFTVSDSFAAIDSEQDPNLTLTVKEMVSAIRLAACNPLFVVRTDYLLMAEKFFFAFKSSNSTDICEFKTCQKLQSGRKRGSLPGQKSRASTRSSHLKPVQYSDYYSSEMEQSAGANGSGRGLNGGKKSKFASLKNNSDAGKTFIDLGGSSSSSDSGISYRPEPEEDLNLEEGETAQDDIPPFQFMRQKLEMVVSILEKPVDDLSKEIKAKVQAELKCVLEKVISLEELSTSKTG